MLLRANLKLARKNTDSQDNIILKRGDFKNVFLNGPFLTARDRRAEARIRLRKARKMRGKAKVQMGNNERLQYQLKDRLELLRNRCKEDIISMAKLFKTMISTKQEEGSVKLLMRS